MNSPDFVPGLREEWEHFRRTRSVFLDKFDDLASAANAALAFIPPMSERPEFVVHALVAQVAQGS